MDFNHSRDSSSTKKEIGTVLIVLRTAIHSSAEPKWDQHCESSGIKLSNLFNVDPFSHIPRDFSLCCHSFVCPPQSSQSGLGWKFSWIIIYCGNLFLPPVGGFMHFCFESFQDSLKALSEKSTAKTLLLNGQYNLIIKFDLGTVIEGNIGLDGEIGSYRNAEICMTQCHLPDPKCRWRRYINYVKWFWKTAVKCQVKWSQLKWFIMFNWWTFWGNTKEINEFIKCTKWAFDVQYNNGGGKINQRGTVVFLKKFTSAYLVSKLNYFHPVVGGRSKNFAYVWDLLFCGKK